MRIADLSPCTTVVTFNEIPLFFQGSCVGTMGPKWWYFLGRLQKPEDGPSVGRKQVTGDGSPRPYFPRTTFMVFLSIFLYIRM